MFCRSACRRDFDAAGRRWVAQAITVGVLTVQELKNGPAAMRALVLDATRRASVCVAPSPDVAPVAPVGYRGYTTQEGLERLMSQAIAARRRG